jgi:pimeloyl-ACP methyl ester carboxylesterase
MSEHPVRTGDRVDLLLTRMNGGNKGPVLLVHGAAVRAQMFALPTLRLSFADYLVEHSYDVWMLDWRGSIALPPREYNLDDAAEHDIPAAVAEVLRLTGASDLKAVVHCAGSNAFFMSMAEGRLPQVSSVVASQVAMHLAVPPMSAIKAKLRAADLVGRAGIRYMTPGEESSQWLVQRAMAALTVGHLECSSVYCHRLTFIFGHLYKHGQLNQATHDRLPEQFGRCATTALQHLSQMIRAGHAIKFDHGPAGNIRRYGGSRPPSYLDPQHFRVPVTFLSGSDNRTYLPVSTQRTYDWLVQANGGKHYRRHLVDGFGHLDTFMGSRAAERTYPLMLAGLER